MIIPKKNYNKKKVFYLLSIHLNKNAVEIKDRVLATTKREAFYTLKYHKPNFKNKATIHLINPTKKQEASKKQEARSFEEKL